MYVIDYLKSMCHPTLNNSIAARSRATTFLITFSNECNGIATRNFGPGFIQRTVSTVIVMLPHVKAARAYMSFATRVTLQTMSRFNMNVC
jgi:tRNA splicing ligase